MNISAARSALVTRTRLRPALSLIALLLVLGFTFQGTRPLYDSDEGRYSSIALALLDSGDFVVPRPLRASWPRKPRAAAPTPDAGES